MELKSRGTFASFTSLAIGVALATITQGAVAQDNTLESIVVTADRQQSALRDVPASIFAVGSNALETTRHTHISEVLGQGARYLDQPQQWPGESDGNSFSGIVRRGSCGAFQMSLDGIPLRASGFCNVNQLFEANTEQAGTIEVIRGPGSILYGANALHGAINIISDQISDNYSRDFPPMNLARTATTAYVARSAIRSVLTGCA